MQNLQNSLKLGLLCPIYLLYGEETLLMEQALAAISKLALGEINAWNFDTVYGDETSPEEITFAAMSGVFFSAKKVIAVRGLPWIKPKRKQDEGEDTPQIEPLLAYARDPNPDTVLVLMQTGTVAKNSRLYKAVVAGGRAVEFTRQLGAEREIWLQGYVRAAGMRIQREVAAHICLLTAEGLLALKGEADKLLLYCADTGEINREAADAILSQGALAGVFDLTDQVAARDGAAAAATLRRLLSQGEAPQMLSGLLSRQYRSILAVRDMLSRGFSQPDIAAKMGINPYFARKCAAQGQKYAARQLLRALDILLAADIDGKTGKGDAAELLELAILRICAL